MKLTVKTLKGSHFEIRVQLTDTVSFHISIYRFFLNLLLDDIFFFLFPFINVTEYASIDPAGNIELSLIVFLLYHWNSVKVLEEFCGIGKILKLGVLLLLNLEAAFISERRSRFFFKYRLFELFVIWWIRIV